MTILTHRHLCTRKTIDPIHPPVECLPWCEYRDGHGGQHPDDQTCMSGHPDIDTGTADEFGPVDAVAVGLVPRHPGTGVEVQLTRAQALAYADLIRACAELLPVDDAGVAR